MGLATTDFDFVRELVFREAGIVLEPGKEYLVEARLTGLSRGNGNLSIEEMVRRMRASTIEPLRRKVVDAMTTNETSFFRDGVPFEVLRTGVLPDLIAKRAASKTLNVWCAASSSGQEPYTIAMTMVDAFPELLHWKINFIASDLSQEMLDRCKLGKYSQLEVNRGLPAKLLVKYFTKQGLEWQVIDKLRNMIEFREINLLQTWPIMPALDLVFIRNVLIYFDMNTKKKILERARRLMKPDGYLFLGGAETTLNLDDSFERTLAGTAGCYRLRPPIVGAKAA